MLRNFINGLASFVASEPKPQPDPELKVAPKPEPAPAAPVRERSTPGKWDVHFKNWIERSGTEGIDPNDIGDQDWGNDQLAQVLDRHYLAYIRPEHTVLELGPGTGRLTRHLIGRCRVIELIDNSAFVIQWMTTYLAGKCEFRAHQLKTEAMPDIADESVDVALAHGVFEHLDFDETANFLEEFHRVLKPGGIVSFNYNTLHNGAGADWFRGHRRGMGKRCIFRFYTPDFMERLADFSGFGVKDHTIGEDRLCQIVLTRRPN